MRGRRGGEGGERREARRGRGYRYVHSLTQSPHLETPSSDHYSSCREIPLSQTNPHTQTTVECTLDSLVSQPDTPSLTSVFS